MFELCISPTIGYELSYYYTFGELDANNTGFGWVGNQTELDVSQVVERISVIKSVSDCPELYAAFRVNQKIVYEEISMNLTRVKYPNGRCCRAIEPELAKTEVVNSIFFREFVQDFPQMNVTGFQMFLSDKTSASFFHPLKFNIDGEQLKSSRETQGPDLCIEKLCMQQLVQLGAKVGFTG